MSFQDDLMRAEAIREVRASGCTTEGIAELIVDFHGAAHVLTHVPTIQKLGEEVAASDSEQGAKMRQLLQEAASKAEAIAMQAAAGKGVAAIDTAIAAGEKLVNEKVKAAEAAGAPGMKVPENDQNEADPVEQAVVYIMTHGYNRTEATKIVREEGYLRILKDKEYEEEEKKEKEKASASQTSKPAESQAAASAGTGAGSVSDAAAESSAPPAAAGTSEAPGPGTAQEKPARKGKGQAQGS